MKKASIFLLCGVLAISMAGCGNAQQASEASTASKTSTAAEASSSPAKDNLAACKTLLGDDMALVVNTPSLFTNIGSSITTDQQNQLLDYHQKILDAGELADTYMSGHLTSLDVPFKQFYDAYNNGGGALSMDTSHVSTDITDIMLDCTTAGYKADNPASATAE